MEGNLAVLAWHAIKMNGSLTFFLLPPSLNAVHCLITSFFLSFFPGPDSAMLVPILLGSLTGFAVLGSAFVSLWLHHRQKTKNIRYPQLGEIYGL